jgi:hypothetical protein
LFAPANSVESSRVVVQAKRKRVQTHAVGQSSAKSSNDDGDGLLGQAEILLDVLRGVLQDGLRT